jgi:hypothetical protein
MEFLNEYVDLKKIRIYYQKCGGNIPRLKYMIILNEVFQNNEIK